MCEKVHLNFSMGIQLRTVSVSVRSRQFKRKLYETRGVREYWIADWRLKQVEIYRREQGMLRLVATLLTEDVVASPLLPGFSCPVVRFFD